MALTFDEKREKILSQVDAEELLEILQVSAEDILDRFEDRLLVAILEGEFDE